MTKLDQTSILSMGMSLIGGCWLAAPSSVLVSDWWMEECQRSVLLVYWHNVILTSSWHRSDITNVTSSHSQAITPNRYNNYDGSWISVTHIQATDYRQNKDYCSKTRVKIFPQLLYFDPIMMMLGQWVTHSYFTHYLLTPAQTRHRSLSILLQQIKVHHIPLLDRAGPQRSVSVSCLLTHHSIYRITHGINDLN